jgi:hypothetical protein
MTSHAYPPAYPACSPPKTQCKCRAGRVGPANNIQFSRPSLRLLHSGRLFLEPVFAVPGAVSACGLRLALRPIDDSMVALDAANRLVAAGAADPGCDAVIRGLRRSVSGGCSLSRPGKFLIDFVAVFEDRDRVSPSAAIVVAVIPIPVSPAFLILQAFAIRLGVRPATV